MNYKEILQLFAQHTGRWDLVDPETYADLGAGVFIRAGQRYLDRRADIGNALAEFTTTLAVGQSRLDIPIRAIYSVHMTTSDGSVALRRFDSVEQARMFFAETRDLTAATAGVPNSYVVGLPRGNGHTAYKDTVKRILILPPTDTEVDISIIGLMYQQELKEASDQNFWTASEPLMLIQAAMLQIEMLYRNSEGVSDLTFALETQLFNLELDTVEEQSAGQDRAQSSWRYIDEYDVPGDPSRTTTAEA